MGFSDLMGLVTGRGPKTNLPRNLRRFLEKVNDASNIVLPWHPEASINDSIQGYGKGTEIKIEFQKRLQCLGILSKEFYLDPSQGKLSASNWYFHIDDILPSIEELEQKSFSQINRVFGANMRDMFYYTNSSDASNDYGRIYSNTAVIEGRLSLDPKTMALDFDFCESKQVSLPDLMYDRTDSSFAREYAVKKAMTEVNKARRG